MYHAQLGRFVSRDPITYSGPDYSLLSYSYSSPSLNVDPLGLEAVLPLSGGNGGGGGTTIPRPSGPTIPRSPRLPRQPRIPSLPRTPRLPTVPRIPPVTPAPAGGAGGGLLLAGAQLCAAVGIGVGVGCAADAYVTGPILDPIYVRVDLWRRRRFCRERTCKDRHPNWPNCPANRARSPIAANWIV